MVAGIRISSKVVEDPHDHLVLGAVAAIKDAKFLLKHLQQFLDISMLLPQDLDNVRHRRLPRTTLRAYGTVDMSITDAHCAKSKRADMSVSHATFSWFISRRPSAPVCQRLRRRL